jgi:hypothetical protein
MGDRPPSAVQCGMRQLHRPSPLSAFHLAVAALALLLSCASGALPSDVIIDGKEPTRLFGRDREAAEILANKWLSDLEKRENYALYEPLKLAVILDPFLHETYESLALDRLEPDAFVGAVASFASFSMFPLQASPAFAAEHSRMPWGRTGSFLWKRDVFRRHLPSDMLAMSEYVGKISAGCESLTMFLAGLFRLRGTPADDIVHLRLPGGHTVALVRFGGKHYYIDNTSIERVDPVAQPWITGEHIKALFGETAALYRPYFKLSAAAFEGRRGLVEEIGLSSGLDLGIRGDDLGGLAALDLESVERRLLDELRDTDPGRARLVAYASQLRAVEDFSVYLDASLRGPLARDLAARTEGTGATLEWIDANIREGSIFALGRERVQMADQTIVYRRGTRLDRALLAYAVFAHQGGEPRLILDGDEASVALDGAKYLFK